MRYAWLIAWCACSGGPGDTTLFPADYTDTYTQVRPCRPSADHDLHNVTVFVDPTANEPYTMRDNPFPTGAVVLKPEYDIPDTTCAGPIIEWTVMVKLADGSAPTTFDWEWQRINADRSIQTTNDPPCYGCHEGCGVPPDGYLLTCSAPTSN